MAGSLNKVTIIGNIGRDPEMRNTQDGRKIANFSVATSESWRDKVTNERQDKTEWHRVVVFNEHLCDVVEKYLKKGAKVYLEGQLQTRKWTDQQGVEKYSTEIVLQRYRGELILLDNRSSGDNSFNNDSYSKPSVSSNNFDELKPAPGPQTTELDDDIPF